MIERTGVPVHFNGSRDHAPTHAAMPQTDLQQRLAVHDVRIHGKIVDIALSCPAKTAAGATSCGDIVLNATT